MAELVFRNVMKDYGVTRVVDDFNLTIHDKEFAVLVGPSGCGKSTTLRMIAGLEEATAGTITIGDRVVNDVEPRDRNIAMVFQSYALYPHMTVRDNLAFGLKMRQLPKADVGRKVADAAQMLGIDELLDRKPRALSGGQRQRVALGRAIVRDPDVFLFDEPLSNLDAKMRVQMRTEIARIHHRLGATMVYVTHDQTEAMTLGQRIVVMKDGRVQQVGPAARTLRAAGQPVRGGLHRLPAMNFLTARLAREGEALTLTFPGVALPICPAHSSRLQPYAGKELILGIRPDAIHDEAAFLDAHPSWSLDVQVDVVEPMGSESYIYFSLNGDNFVARVAPESNARVSARHRLAFDMKKLHFFDRETQKAI